jgi:hypothetical protein
LGEEGGDGDVDAAGRRSGWGCHCERRSRVQSVLDVKYRVRRK